MANKRFVIAILSFLFAPFLVSAIPINKYDISSPIYGPFEKYAANPTLQIDIGSNSLISQEVYCYLKIMDNNVLVGQAKSTNTNISKYETGRVYVTLLTHAYLDDDGMNILFHLMDAKNTTIIVSQNFQIYPLKSSQYDPIKYSQNKISESPSAFGFKNGKVVTYQETYQFNEFLDYFLTDIYYRLLINQYCFSYQYMCDLIYQKAYLVLPEAFEEFCYIEANENGEIRVPLDIVRDNAKYYLSFPKKMYVNPATLEMALNEMPGLSPTSFFYLPVNHLEDLAGATFLFVIEGLGLSKSSFCWETTFLANQALLGPCENSSYCVIGGIAL